MAGSTISIGQSYTNQNLEDLQKRVDAANENLKTFNTAATSDDDLKKRAESELSPTYNAQRGEQEALKGSAATALSGSLAALDRQYNRDAESLGRSYDAQLADANNNMLSRGFSNSSLALAMTNHVNDQRNRALQQLQLERQAGESQAQATYNDAVTAADAALARLETDRQTNIDARYQALKEADQQRVLQNTQAQNALTQYVSDLMLQIEALRQQGYSQYLAQQQAEADQAAAEADRAFQREQFEYNKKIQDAELAMKQKQFDAEYEATYGSGRGSSGGSSGSSGGSASQTAAKAATAGQTTGSLAGKYNQMATPVNGAISSALAALQSVKAPTGVQPSNKNLSVKWSEKGTGTTGTTTKKKLTQQNNAK